jgi:hypothetical protein
MASARTGLQAMNAVASAARSLAAMVLRRDDFREHALPRTGGGFSLLATRSKSRQVPEHETVRCRLRMIARCHAALMPLALLTGEPRRRASVTWFGGLISYTAQVVECVILQRQDDRGPKS